MSEAKDRTVAFNVRLKPSEPTSHPRATNYKNVGVAQGITYLDFGFIEPGLLAAIGRRRRMAKPHQRDRRAPSSPAWRWGWRCWRGYIGRFSKSW